jgi:hypothetical protein
LPNQLKPVLAADAMASENGDIQLQQVDIEGDVPPRQR